MDKFSIFGSKRDRAYGWEKVKFWFDLSIFWSSTGSCKEKEEKKSRYETLIFLVWKLSQITPCRGLCRKNHNKSVFG